MNTKVERHHETCSGERGLGWDSTTNIWLCYTLVLWSLQEVRSMYMLSVPCTHCCFPSTYLSYTCTSVFDCLHRSKTYHKRSKIGNIKNRKWGCYEREYISQPLTDILHNSQLASIMCSCMHVHALFAFLCTIVRNISKYNPYHIWQHFLQPLKGRHSPSLEPRLSVPDFVSLAALEKNRIFSKAERQSPEWKA